MKSLALDLLLALNALLAGAAATPAPEATLEVAHRPVATFRSHYNGADPQARIDYAYNAIDKVTLAAKEALQQYYGKGPEKSYFVGCSNGGRHAMVAAARLGDRIEGRTSVAAERLADVVDAAKPRVAHAAAVASERATDAGIVIGEALSELRQEASHLREDARGRLRR